MNHMDVHLKFFNTHCCFSIFVLMLSHVELDPMAPLSMESSRQQYWCGLPFPTPGDRPDPGTEPTSPALAGEFFTTERPGKPILYLDSTMVNILPCLYPFLYESTCMCVVFFSEPFEHKLLIWAKN